MWPNIDSTWPAREAESPCRLVCLSVCLSVCRRRAHFHIKPTTQRPQRLSDEDGTAAIETRLCAPCAPGVCSVSRGIAPRTRGARGADSAIQTPSGRPAFHPAGAFIYCARRISHRFTIDTNHPASLLTALESHWDELVNRHTHMSFFWSGGTAFLLCNRIRFLSFFGGGPVASFFIISSSSLLVFRIDRRCEWMGWALPFCCCCCCCCCWSCPRRARFERSAGAGPGCGGRNLELASISIWIGIWVWLGFSPSFLKRALIWIGFGLDLDWIGLDWIWNWLND